MPDKQHFDRDSRSRTSLIRAAKKGDIEQVRKIIFSLPGTGLGPARLGLIQLKDASGFTAFDVATKCGHKKIARLLYQEQMRMEFFE